MNKQLTAHVFVAAVAVAAPPSWGLGFGRVASDAVLGQTLRFSAPVHVDAGEHFGPECVGADVYFGEGRLPPNLVRTTAERVAGDGEWLVRVTTTEPIGEPIVQVAVNIGCGRGFSRRFTTFADPPTVVAAAPANVFQPQASGDATAPPPSGRTPVARAAASHGSERARAGAGTAPRKGPTLALADELNTRPARPARHAVTAPAPVPPATARTGAPAPAPGTAPRLVLDGGYAHLKLDIEDPVIPPPSSAASTAAASLALADLNDPETRQLQLLEQNIQQLRRQSQTDRAQTSALQAQLAQAEQRADLLPWVLGLLALAVAGLVALAWRMRQQQRLVHSAWFNESQFASQAPVAASAALVAGAAGVATAEPEEPAPSIAGEVVGEPLEPGDSGFGVTDSGGLAEPYATSPLDRAALAGVVGAEAAPRELSVEELLDLEQQADFFIALGQEDAAVDLLMSHLRSAGGQSPLPYTKLLEIYRRQGDRAPYERTRARFNRRFNAYAPDWDTGPTAGRALEEYPETMARLEAAWAAPIDAMAQLEAMLFKRDESGELFDLPAYRDVLLLYSLARDLYTHGEGAEGPHVDVLLPLDDHEPAMSLPLGFATPAVDDAEPPAGAVALDAPGVGAADDDGATRFELPALDFDLGHVGRSGLDSTVPTVAPPATATPRPVPAPLADDVHATLDDPFNLGLEPLAPTPPAPDWDLEPPPGDDAPPKPRH